jgi:hypothetical protein
LLKLEICLTARSQTAAAASCTYVCSFPSIFLTANNKE